ncbi:MAG: pirin family protein [Rhodocyclales bacterium]|nr:pirin family protein [Rhodocyclales bacterium]
MSPGKPQRAPAPPPIERIAARSADIGGGITVQRVLPVRERRTIGAWCFLDHAGPVVFEPGSGMRVGAHPHCGLQTFTWLIEGEVLHRDSLGNEQVIRPGQVNLMTAGRGIAHSEESLPGEQRLHAAQLWIALPAAVADCAPAFEHHPALPQWDLGGCRVTLLTGSYSGHVAPTRAHSPLVGLDLFSPQSAAIGLPLDPGFEYGILPLTGEAHLGGQRFAADELAYLGRGRNAIGVDLAPGTRLLLIGGEPLGEEIVIWWNFVGHSKGEIAQAQRDWESDRNSGDGRFGRVVGYAGEPLKAPPLPWAGV